MASGSAAMAPTDIRDTPMTNAPAIRHALRRAWLFNAFVEAVGHRHYLRPNITRCQRTIPRGQPDNAPLTPVLARSMPRWPMRGTAMRRFVSVGGAVVYAFLLFVSPVRAQDVIKIGAGAPLT